MDANVWFEDLPVLGKLPPDEAAVKLREVGEDEAAAALDAGRPIPAGTDQTFGGAMLDLLPFRERPWKYTAHAFGYIAPSKPNSDPQPVVQAGNIEPDSTLKRSRIKITLNRLRVADYPGGGTHFVLFDFYAQNQLPDAVEHLHYNATVRAYEGQQAATINYPIFLGLNVGSQGVAFRCRTVNVKNEEDEHFLGFLESEVFRAGLKLASIAQPAIAPFSQMAMNLTKNIMTRHRNQSIQDFQMGLDFKATPFGASLREGAYIAIQIPDKLRLTWDWTKWVYNPQNGEMVAAVDLAQLIPYNYVVFGIGRYEGA